MSSLPLEVEVYNPPLSSCPGGLLAGLRTGLAPRRAMHPAPSLLEAYPNTKSEDQAQQHHGQQAPPPPPPPPPPPQDHQYNHTQQPPAPSAHAPPPPPLSPQRSTPHNLQQLLQRQVTPPSHHHGQRDISLPTSTPPISPPPAREDAAVPYGHDAPPADGAYSAESSQSIVFSAKDGAEVSSARRASRRRTGPLTPESREKAALIRKVGACHTCRKKRIACHPSHSNLPTWEVARRQYGSRSPMREPAPGVSHPISPAANAAVGHSYFQDPQEMDVDPIPHSAAEAAPAASAAAAAATASSTPHHSPCFPRRPSLPLPPVRQLASDGAPRGEAVDAHMRTPLPAGPRLDRATAITPSLTNAPASSSIASVLSGPPKGRYTAATALLISWEDDQDWRVQEAVSSLARVLEHDYHYHVAHVRIPTSSPAAPGGCRNSARWLQSSLIDFIDRNDSRDVLKIVYYTGDCLADDNKEMVLASVHDRVTRTSTIRWSGLWETLEGACSDTLVLLDAPYSPMAKSLRQKGVLEVIVAAESEEQYKAIGRNYFTQLLTKELRLRANSNSNPLSATELHSRLVAQYQQERANRFGPPLSSPLLMQLSGNWRVPSVTLYPLHKTTPRLGQLQNTGGGAGHRLDMTIRLANRATMSLEAWADWLRMMPDGIKDVQLQGPVPWLG